MLTHGDRITQCKLSSDGTAVYSSSRDWTIRKWDIATGAELKRYESPRTSATLVDFAVSDDRNLVTGIFGDYIAQWDQTTGKINHSFSIRYGGGRKLLFDEGMQACVFRRKRVNENETEYCIDVWDCRTGKKEFTSTFTYVTEKKNKKKVVKAHGIQEKSLLISPDGKRMWIGSGPNLVEIDTTTHTQISCDVFAAPQEAMKDPSTTDLTPGPIQRISLSKDGKQLRVYQTYRAKSTDSRYKDPYYAQSSGIGLAAAMLRQVKVEHTVDRETRKLISSRRVKKNEFWKPYWTVSGNTLNRIETLEQEKRLGGCFVPPGPTSAGLLETPDGKNVIHFDQNRILVFDTKTRCRALPLENGPLLFGLQDVYLLDGGKTVLTRGKKWRHWDRKTGAHKKHWMNKWERSWIDKDGMVVLDVNPTTGQVLGVPNSKQRDRIIVADMNAPKYSPIVLKHLHMNAPTLGWLLGSHSALFSWRSRSYTLFDLNTPQRKGLHSILRVPEKARAQGHGPPDQWYIDAKRLELSCDGRLFALCKTYPFKRIYLWSAVERKYLGWFPGAGKPAQNLTAYNVFWSDFCPQRLWTLSRYDREKVTKAVHLYEYSVDEIKPMDHKTMAKWITQLSSNRWADREQASAALLTMPKDNIAMLDKFTVADPEAIVRIKTLKKKIESRTLTTPDAFTLQASLSLPSPVLVKQVHDHPDKTHVLLHGQERKQPSDKRMKSVFYWCRIDTEKKSLRIIEKFTFPHVVNTVRFADDGTLLLATPATVELYTLAKEDCP